MLGWISKSDKEFVKRKSEFGGYRAWSEASSDRFKELKKVSKFFWIVFECNRELFKYLVCDVLPVNHAFSAILRNLFGETFVFSLCYLRGYIGHA